MIIWQNFKKNTFTTRQNSMVPLKYDLSEIQIPKFIQNMPLCIQVEIVAKLYVLKHQRGDPLWLVGLSRMRGSESKALVVRAQTKSLSTDMLTVVTLATHYWEHMLSMSCAEEQRQPTAELSFTQSSPICAKTRICPRRLSEGIPGCPGHCVLWLGKTALRKATY